jgi:hypothetical protein
MANIVLITAIISILIGILILIWPKLLNYFVAFWLILTGILSILNIYI